MRYHDRLAKSSLLFLVFLFLLLTVGAATGRAAEAQLTAMEGVSASSLRWWDVASNVYDSAYSGTYTYDDATVTLIYGTGGDPVTLAGHLSAVNLKPNFAYQIKLEGKPSGQWGDDGDDVANENIGFLGRWWRVQPNPGNSSDADYLAHHDDPDYIYIGYLVFDFFITDSAGDAEVDFALDSSLHVLVLDAQGSPGACDTPFQWRTVVGWASDPAYATDVGPTDVGVFGRQESGRPCYGEAVLATGSYDCQFILTEESFHQTEVGSGNWASVMAFDQLQFDTSAGTTLPDAHDYVDIGNPASEAGHALSGWGPIEPDTHGGNWGGLGGESPPGKCRTIWSPVENDPVENWASLELDFGISDTEAKCLAFRHLDGGSDDSFVLYIDGTEVFSVAAPPGTEIWYWAYIDVTGYTGVHTVRFEATAPPGPYYYPYGQVGIDKIYIGTQVTPVPVDAEAIACGQTKKVDFHLNLDCDDGPIRGYTVRVLCPEGEGRLTFESGDITVNVLPEGLPAEDYAWQVYRSPGAAATNDWTIDYAILGAAAVPDGIPNDKDLFSIEFHGVGDGVGHVIIEHARVGLVPGGLPPPVGRNETTITVDCIPPPPVTGINSLRGHNKVNLSWTYTGDADDELEIWRGMWYVDPPDTSVSAYPEYDDHVSPPDVEPTWPIDYPDLASSDEWFHVHTVPANQISIIDFPNSPDGLRRGVYYYILFARDGAGNHGPRPDAYARSTSYLLGDLPNLSGTMPADGRIRINPEINRLGMCYGTVDGDAAYDPFCDIGPTDDMSSAGIPLTDDVIEFEDLMIFALNFDTEVTKDRFDMGGAIARFAWAMMAPDTWSLVLLEPCPGLQGLNLRLSLPAGVVRTVVAGDLLAEQTEPHFLRNVARNGLDVSLALLGTGACFDGRGELLQVKLDGPHDLGDVEISARNTVNAKIETSFDGASDMEDIPLIYHLSGNHPNPFNPATEIYFELPEPQRVELVVYAVDGRRVVTLKNEPLPAGRHSVTWMGQNDTGERVASGIYFCRLKAGAFSETLKMTLVK